MNRSVQNTKLRDVARRSGVSTSTVSRFLNKPSVVAEDTAVRIREAIAELGYIPNLLAGSFATQKSDLVAVEIPTLTNSVFSETIESMTKELAQAGVAVMLGLTDFDPDQTRKLVITALSRRADAIILTSEIEPDLRDLLRRSDITVIEIWDLPEDAIDVAVGFSHRSVGEEIARFIDMRGYSRPHLLTSQSSRARQRREGFLKVWSALGYPPPSEESLPAPLSFGQARGALARIKRLTAQPDVIVCGSDLLAQGVIVEAHAAGLKVPDDIAVIGFGNASLAGEMRPTITSIDIDGKRIAVEAIALLQQRARGDIVRERVINVGFRLIARESA